VRARSMAVSVMVILCYYLLLSVAMTMARRSGINAALAMWMPNGVLAVVATTLFIRVGADLPIFPRLARLTATLDKTPSRTRRGGQDSSG